MIAKCVIACEDANGTPTLVPCAFNCAVVEYEEGFHYDRAMAWAEERGYEGPYVVMDQNDIDEEIFELVGGDISDLVESEVQITLELTVKVNLDRLAEIRGAESVIGDAANWILDRVDSDLESLDLGTVESTHWKPKG